MADGLEGAKSPLRWEGDYSHERFRAQCATLTGEPNEPGYSVKYEWDRGGLPISTSGSLIPYKVEEYNSINSFNFRVPPPTTNYKIKKNHSYTNLLVCDQYLPTLLQNHEQKPAWAEIDRQKRRLSECDMTSGMDAVKKFMSRNDGQTSRSSQRLPLIPQKQGGMQKSFSAVQLATPYTGKFTSKQFTVQPEPVKKIYSQKSLPSSSPSSPTNGNAKNNEVLNAKQIQASRDLWRESVAGPHYWAPRGKKDPRPKWDATTDEVPGMAIAASNGGSVNWPNREADGLTLFSKACQDNDYKLVEYLFRQFDPDITIKDMCGRNIFHNCARRNGYDTLTFLLRNVEPKKATLLLMEQDIQGNTPLHLAAEMGSMVISELFVKLVRAKELVVIPNKLGQIPMDLARKQRAWHLAKFLDPLEYVENPLSMSSRVKSQLGGGAEAEEEDEEEEEEDEDGDGEDNDQPREKSKFKNLLTMDRECNKIRAAEVKNKKKKGGKKKKKKS